MADLKLPSKRDIIGVLLSAEEVKTKTSDIILVSIQDIDDEVITISTSPAYWKKIGKLFPVDSIIKASYEVRMKDITGYTDDKGVMTAHTSDGNNLVGINRFSSLSFQRMLDSKDKDSDIAVISSVEPDRVQAVATYLSAYVRR